MSVGLEGAARVSELWLLRPFVESISFFPWPPPLMGRRLVSLLRVCASRRGNLSRCDPSKPSALPMHRSHLTSVTLHVHVHTKLPQQAL